MQLDGGEELKSECLANGDLSRLGFVGILIFPIGIRYKVGKCAMYSEVVQRTDGKLLYNV